MLKTTEGLRLQALLLSHPAYEKNPEMVVDALKFLEEVAIDTEGKEKPNDDWGIPTDRLKSAFQRSREGYAPYKEALEGLKLLEMTKQYIAPSIFNGNKGTAARYRVTEVYRGYYNKAATEWRVLPEDEGKLVRKRGRRIREAKGIVDAFSRSHEILSCTAWMDWDSVPQGGKRLAIARAIMGRLQRVEFGRIGNDGNRSRLYHPLANMPKEFRKGLWSTRLAYSGEVDVRACWPTFLAAQLRKLNEEDEAFQAECRDWTESFCDKLNDPREAILRETRLSISADVLKGCLNKYLNGSLQAALKSRRKVSPRYTALDIWFASRYPLMHRAWEAEGPSSLAYEIGLNFETPLMTDSRLYEYAEEKGIVLYYQFDGFGVFAHPEKQEALENILAGLCRLMSDISTEKFRVPIVVR